MREIVQGIRYRNLDEAREALRKAVGQLPTDPFDDDGKEPEGLLSVITEDLVGEEAYYRAFDLGMGTLVPLVRKAYSGFGPPADEADYMGFVSRRECYILEGAELPIEIEDCPAGARDLHHLELLVLEGNHPLDQEQVARRLNLPSDWTFDDLLVMIQEGTATANQIDRIIHGKSNL